MLEKNGANRHKSEEERAGYQATQKRLGAAPEAEAQSCSAVESLKELSPERKRQNKG